MAVLQVEGLQLHGTGTSLGDPIEVGAAAGAPGQLRLCAPDLCTRRCTAYSWAIALCS